MLLGLLTVPFSIASTPSNPKSIMLAIPMHEETADTLNAVITETAPFSLLKSFLRGIAESIGTPKNVTADTKRVSVTASIKKKIPHKTAKSASDIESLGKDW